MEGRDAGRQVETTRLKYDIGMNGLSPVHSGPVFFFQVVELSNVETRRDVDGRRRSARSPSG